MIRAKIMKMRRL